MSSPPPSPAGVGLYDNNRPRLPSVPVAAQNALRSAAYGSMGAVLHLWWRPREILVLGHMRAGSSLLSQLLASHPDILGRGELHLPYRTDFDRIAAQGKVAWANRTARPRATFTVDKILHDWLLLPKDADVLRADNVRTVFLVREAHPTLQSLVASFGHSPEQACDYYTTRLRTLVDLARTAAAGPDPTLLVTHADLTRSPGPTLAALTSFLGLSTPLRADYEPSGGGVDPSANFATGRILRDDEKVVRHEADLADALVAEATSVHREVLAELSTLCAGVGD